MTKTLYQQLPSELAARCDDAGYEHPTWADVKYQAESGLDLCVDSEDWYTPSEQRRFRKMFTLWIAKAKKAMGKEAA